MVIDSKLVKIMSSVLNVEEGIISAESIKDDFEEWDSLEHIKLILEIESQYNIKFELDVIPELTTVKRLQEEIIKLQKDQL